MPNFKNPKYKDATGIAEGMEKGPDYRKNIKEGLYDLQKVITGRSRQDSNKFDDPMGSEETKRRIDPGYSGQIETDSIEDRKKAYRALDEVRKRWADKLPPRQPESFPQQEQMSDEDLAEIQQHLQRSNDKRDMQYQMMKQQDPESVVRENEMNLDEREMRKKFLQDLVKRRIGQ